MSIIENINKPTPRWFKRLKRAVNAGLTPVAVTTIKALWVGSETELNKILLIITITLPGLMEVIGMLMSDEENKPQ